MIPRPRRCITSGGWMELSTPLTIGVPEIPEALFAARWLAELLRSGAGVTCDVVSIHTHAAAAGATIEMRLDEEDATLGDEGYELVVDASRVTIRAARSAGLFYGVQTLRQLLPPEIEGRTGQVTCRLPLVRIVDWPRFAWRGAMLDVARHFFDVPIVQRFIDLLATYKMNRLHLHLTDDQGWRIAIDSWPELTRRGGATAVDGMPGGWFTKERYAQIVRYAAERHVVVVPEIDVPGHTNAALASYAELTSDGIAREPYTGDRVGFSALAVEKEITYRFLADALREIAEITPGPFLHIGGDEAKTLDEPAYVRFVERVVAMVTALGKRPVGWEEIAKTALPSTAVVQVWWTELGTPPPWKTEAGDRAVARGAAIVVSPARKAYLDMKYDARTVPGGSWAGKTTVRDSYEWDPLDVYRWSSPAEAAARIVGVEAALWSEGVATLEEIELMTLPRLAGIAEIGWSDEARSWDEYEPRLAAHAARWRAMGVRFHDEWDPSTPR